MAKKVFKFRFSTPEDANQFKLHIDKTCGADVRVKNPYIGKGVETDSKTVLVTGTGSIVFDMLIKDRCQEACDRFGGCFVG